MSAEFAYEVCDKCEYATMAMIDEFNNPYCVTLSIAREGENIYFHTAKTGQKIDCLRANNNICLSCVGDTFRLLDEFTTEYESAIIRGKAYEVLEDEEKIFALKLLSLRHTPTNMHKFDEAISASLKRTGIWKIKIDSITGKRKKYSKDGVELKYGKME